MCQAFFHYVLTKTVGDRYCYYSHFIVEIEPQSGHFFCWYMEKPQSLILVSLYPWSTIFSLCHPAHSNVKGKAERKMSTFLSHTLFHARISCVRQGTASISIFRRFYFDKSSNESCLSMEMVPSHHLFAILSQVSSQRVIHKLSLFGTPC